MTGLTGLTGPTGRGAAGLEPITGVCSAVFAYDIGFAIDLEAAERSLELGQRAGLSPTRRAPHYVQYRPAPLRVTRRAATIPLGAYQTAADVSALVYDFGAVSITFQVPISGPLESLLGLSAALSDNPELLAASRRRAQELLEEIRPAVGKASLADLVEDYAIFHLHSPGPPGGATTGESPLRFVARHRELLARVLRAETGRLSSQEVRDALASRLAYAPTDLVIIDWNAALLLAPPGEADDVRAVLEFANVELLEMRFLDDRLDETLDRAYVAMDRVTWRRAMIPGADAAGVAKLARLQVDHALLFEGVNNALKLLGDQYLARVYRMAAARLHLPEWDASVLRKLQTVQDIYEKITGRLDARRMETLEWIIIVLILVSIVMPFVVTYGH